jgi:hypothetical protein
VLPTPSFMTNKPTRFVASGLLGSSTWPAGRAGTGRAPPCSVTATWMLPVLQQGAMSTEYSPEEVKVMTGNPKLAADELVEVTVLPFGSNKLTATLPIVLFAKETTGCCPTPDTLKFNRAFWPGVVIAMVTGVPVVLTVPTTSVMSVRPTVTVPVSSPGNEVPPEKTITVYVPVDGSGLSNVAPQKFGMPMPVPLG